MDEPRFGDWLRAELARRGWTQTALAARLPATRGVESKQSHVSKWLRNERRPSPQSCALIAAALGVPLDDVLGRAGHRPADVVAPAAEGELPVRDQLISLISRTPEEQLRHLVPLFEWLYHEGQQAQGGA